MGMEKLFTLSGNFVYGLFNSLTGVLLVFAVAYSMSNAKLELFRHSNVLITSNA